MNWLHIEAMIKGTGIQHRAEFPQGILVTNGHAMLLHGGQFKVDSSETYEPLQKLWTKYLAEIGEVVQPGMLIRDGGVFLRKLGPEWIDEAYFRCFNSDNVSWRLGPDRGGHHPLMVTLADALVAVVMPMRFNGEPCALSEDTPDSEVFEPYCSERNNHYLLTKKRIAADIEELLESISANETKIEDLEDENEDSRCEIEVLERRAKAMDVERSTSPATDDTR